jgi:hypothetical protein
MSEQIPQDAERQEQGGVEGAVEDLDPPREDAEELQDAAAAGDTTPSS